MVFWVLSIKQGIQFEYLDSQTSIFFIFPKGWLFMQGLTQTTILYDQWVSVSLYKRVI